MSSKTMRLLAAVAAVGIPSLAFAQTDGTWNVNVGGTWSTASNWLGGNIPDGGGTATFPEVRSQTAGAVYTVDTTSRTLSQIVFDSGWLNEISASGGAVINMPASGGLTINSVSSLRSSPAVFYTTPNRINAPINGTGNLIKTGPGNSALASTTSTFTGDILVNQGSLYVTSGNTNSLGNAANTVRIANGSTFGVSAAALSANRNIVVEPSGGVIRLFANLTLTTAGNLSGSGTLSKGSGSALILQGANAGFTGALRIDAGQVTLQSGGTLGAGGAVELPGTVLLDNAATNVDNRLSGRNIITRGGDLVVVGNAGAATTESLGNLTVETGQTFITVNPNAAQSATVGFTGLTRNNRAQLFFRGTNLGDAPAAGVAEITFPSAPATLVGGGGATNTTTASIIPWTWGNRVSNTSNGSTFVSYESGRLVALPDASYATDINSAAANENVVIAASTTVTNATTVNALRINAPSSSALAVDGAKITLGSGALLSTTTSTTSPQISIANDIDAGSNEFVVVNTVTGTTTTPGLTLNGVLSGSNGFTRAGPGIVRINNPNNDYTGVTTFNGGTTIIGSSTISNGSPSVLGQSGDIVLNGSGGVVRLWVDGDVVINRNIVANLGHASTLGIGTRDFTGDSLVINGSLTLNAPNDSFTTRFLNIEAGNEYAAAAVINGLVSGTGGLRGTGGTYVKLNNANTYTSGTLIGNSAVQSGSGVSIQLSGEVWEAGNNNAFGTGPIYFGQVTASGGNFTTTGAIAAGGGPRTINNDILLGFGVAKFTGTNPITLAGNIDLNGNAQGSAVITLDDPATVVTVTGSINRGNLTKSGPGKLILAGSNGYSGITYIREGTLSVANLGNGLASPGNLSQSSGSSGFLLINGTSPTKFGTLQYTGGGETSTRAIRVDGIGGAIDASGSGALVLTGAFDSPAPISGFTGVTLAATTPSFALNSIFSGRLIEGSTLTNTNLPAGTTITEVGPNYVRMSNLSTNAANATSQSVTVTLPAWFTTRNLTLTGTNTDLNTMGMAIGGTFNTGIVKEGPGTWQLTGNNTYTGGTTINAGTLLINNTAGSGTGTGNVTVNAGGTLGGNGTISGAVNSVGGKVAPGNSAGTLTVGSVALDATSTYAVELESISSFDKLVVTAAASVNGAMTIDLLGGYEPAHSDTFTVLTSSGLTGTFTNTNAWGLIPAGTGKAMLPEYTATDVVLKEFTKVGDVDFDGLINNQDIAPFVAVLTGVAPLPPSSLGFAADVNGDGLVNNQDIAPFVALLTGGPSPVSDADLAPLMSLVPEPASLSLLALGGLALRRRRR